MKLDPDLVRDILIALEESNHDPASWIEPFLPDRDQMVVTYHVLLLHEAGFIEGIDLSHIGSTHWAPRRLTYEGHQFLGTIRDREIWRETKAVAKKGGVEALRALGKVALKVAEQEFKKRTGIEL